MKHNGINSEDEILSCLIDNKEYYEVLCSKGVLLYGAGSKGFQAYELLKERNIEIEAFVDSDAQRWGGKYFDKKIISLSDAVNNYKDHTILVTMAYNNAKSIIGKLNEWEGKVRVMTSPFKTENVLLDYEGLSSNKNLIFQNYESLADELSQDIFIDTINWKCTGDSLLTASHAEDPIWLWGFESPLIDYSTINTYVDVGSFNGDTSIRYMIASGRKTRIICVEPDKNALSEMKHHMSSLGLEEGIEYIGKGCMNEPGKLIFYQTSKEGYESSNFISDVNSIMPIDRKKDETAVKTVVEVDTLDNICMDCKGRILIKIDAQGSEYDVLRGARRLLKDSKPILFFEFATHSSHVFDVIPLIRDANSTYKFYLRCPGFGNNVSRPILYAI